MWNAIVGSTRLGPVCSCLLLLPACAADDPLAQSSVLRDGALASGDGIVGTYQAYVARGYDGTSWVVHKVVVDGQSRTLEFDGEPGSIPPRSLIEVWGQDTPDAIEVDDYEVLAPPPEPIINADQYEPRKLAAIILHWGTPSHDHDDVDQRMFSADDSTRNYWAEISYGKETMTGDVFGPYQVQNQGCSTDWIAFAAKDQLELAGVDPNDYDQFMYIFPQVSCGWSGLAMLGYPHDPAEDSWYNGSFNCVVRNQEVAHNYGLMHTRFYYNCYDGGVEVPFSSNCSYQEYGSPYDPMGGGCGHMATPDKEYMGWLEECNVVTATADGTFNILPTELPCNGTQALRVPTFDGRYYYIEYRQRIGFDEDQDADFGGVLVHVSRPPESEWDGGPSAYLIDLGIGGFLGEGESYSDPEGTVTITVDEQRETHAVVSVVFPGAPAADPTCSAGGTPEQHAGVWGSLECTGGPFMPDTAPPMVSFTRPTDGAQFAPGDEVEVVVDATDDVYVSGVELWVDDQLAGTSSEAPYTWQLPVVGTGAYQLTAVASDGIQEAEASIGIEVTDTPGGDSGGGDAGDGGDGGSDDGGSGPDDDDDGADGGDGGSGGADDDHALPPGFGGDPFAGGCRVAPQTRDLPGWAWLLLLVGLGRRRRA